MVRSEVREHGGFLCKDIFKKWRHSYSLRQLSNYKAMKKPFQFREREREEKGVAMANASL